MENKENVNEKNFGLDVADVSAEGLLEAGVKNVGGDGEARVDSAAILTKGEADEEKKAILGKFKSVDALTKAYGALEAAFTKKSQQVASMREKIERLEQKAAFGVEKLRRNAGLRREREREFDGFLRELGGGIATNSVSDLTGKNGETPIAESNVSERTPARENCAENVGRYGLNEEKSGEMPADRLDEGLNTQRAERFERPSVSDGTGENPIWQNGGKAVEQVGVGQEKNRVAREKAADFSQEDLYDAVKRNEKVRLKIIGEYLASIGKSSAPIGAGGMTTLAIPPQRAKTVNEAGGMALRYFKNTQAER